MGGHRDHRLVRMLLEEMSHNLYYFADYPYIDLYQLDISLWTENLQVKYGAPISAEGLLAWQNAVACYQSQISSFWLDENDMRMHLERYSLTGEGNRLWGIA